MPFWKELDMNDHNHLVDALHQLVTLRLALTDRWINQERFVAFMDHNREGTITYDQFYDGLSQFGLHEEIVVDSVFAYIDREKTGMVTSEALLTALQLGGQADEEESDDSSDDELEAFPETLLVGLVAHNNLKASIMKFVKENIKFFKRVKLVTTGSTGRALNGLGLTVDTLVSSGPLGGDQEIGGMIARGEVAAVFFFTDPLSAHPHEPDIQALNRICCVHDTMFANNPSTAQALIYSLEYSAFGFSRLTGHNPVYQKQDSKIVLDYKKQQQKVINKVSRASSSSESTGRRRKSSVIHAPPSRATVTKK
mmetsp:Transcript_8143/g.9392  ORF Transcript_8143/g.9392 Transcript_8143/m.9392 type:complete len:310 (-) Transcript_8143:314-1243(-)